jgi:uncharacterized membrane protein
MKAVRVIIRVLFGAFFVVAGVTHFTNRDFFTSIVPPYLPWPELLVYVSGVAEIALGVLLMVPATTRIAAWGLIALLIAVFPANIHMAMNPQLYPDTPLAALLIRLPLQGLLVAVAFWFTRGAGIAARSQALEVR